ncbi:MAG: hypothetical protein K1X88_34030 [Nannocystaceae bacterium]|nr:hypothetical protein [Nannocystaceae bacterium]
MLVPVFAAPLACAEPDASEASSDDRSMPVEPRQLVDAYTWVTAPIERDAFASAKPETVECPPIDGYGAVDFGGYPAFEVHTDFCDYITVEQPLGDDVEAGEYVNVRMWHFDLTAPEPATGYAAVAVAGEVRWEYETPIPADGKLASYGWITDEPIAAGTFVQFHVHNHGLNSWNLIEITAEPGDQAPG